ncbi:MAG: ATP-binding cassette domain-containing protein [Clostridia bacterium]|nr:ATP-binding cassette domain-containing protein [Clostridia bacterium]
MEYVLTTSALSKKYRRFEALKDFNIHIPKGAIYGFVGRNGAGKTTLIRVICGLQEPTSGEYTLYGIPNGDKRISKVRRRMGAVVEAPSIYLDMTAEDNLKQQALVLGLPSFESIPDILRLVGLEYTGKKKARNFSLGMKQRLGIAVALIGNPDFIVLDEPINGLDPQGIVDIRELILKLNREHGITVLISSHILGELSKLATHYGFIEKGRMVREVSAAELEAACRKCVKVEVSDTKALVRALDRMKMDYEVLSETEATVYGDVILSGLVKELAKENCDLLHSHEQDENLETYFINLIGGGKHE